MSLSDLFEEGSRIVKSGELSPFALKEEYPLMITGVLNDSRIVGEYNRNARSGALSCFALKQEYPLTSTGAFP